MYEPRNSPIEIHTAVITLRHLPQHQPFKVSVIDSECHMCPSLSYAPDIRIRILASPLCTRGIGSPPHIGIHHVLFMFLASTRNTPMRVPTRGRQVRVVVAPQLINSADRTYTTSVVLLELQALRHTLRPPLLVSARIVARLTARRSTIQSR